MFPEIFTERMQAQLGADYQAFMNALQSEAPVSRRWNLEKIQPDFSKKIGWCEAAEFLPTRPIFTLDPLIHAGAYYVQEASSMMIDYALRQHLDMDKPLKILDLCAAPGGKSTLLTALMNQQSILVSNEVIKTRVNILKENIIKWGNPNVVVTNHEAEDFTGLEDFFDVILIDAPCSGEGLFRKDERAKEEWSQENVNLCAARQKKISGNIAKCLAPDGFLLYSTCTYNTQENIENTVWIAQEFDLESVSIGNIEQFGVVVVEKKDVLGYQCYPHKVKGEGFYFSLLRKNNESGQKSFFPKKSKNLEKLNKKQIEIVAPFLTNKMDYELFIKKNGMIVAIPSVIAENAFYVENHLQRIGVGVEVGEIKGNDFVPSHDLALNQLLSDSITKVELSEKDAISYLRKDVFELDFHQKGWSLMSYQDLPLGWAKILPNRINNYYPQEWRIRMSVK